MSHAGGRLYEVEDCGHEMDLAAEPRPLKERPNEDLGARHPGGVHGGTDDHFAPLDCARRDVIVEKLDDRRGETRLSGRLGVA